MNKLQVKRMADITKRALDKQPWCACADASKPCDDCFDEAANDLNDYNLELAERSADAQIRARCE